MSAVLYIRSNRSHSGCCTVISPTKTMRFGVTGPKRNQRVEIKGLHIGGVVRSDILDVGNGFVGPVKFDQHGGST